LFYWIEIKNPVENVVKPANDVMFQSLFYWIEIKNLSFPTTFENVNSVSILVLLDRDKEPLGIEATAPN